MRAIIAVRTPPLWNLPFSSAVCRSAALASTFEVSSDFMASPLASPKVFVGASQ
jgi:hypothetical protein